MSTPTFDLKLSLDDAMAVREALAGYVLEHQPKYADDPPYRVGCAQRYGGARQPGTVSQEGRTVRVNIQHHRRLH